MRFAYPEQDVYLPLGSAGKIVALRHAVVQVAAGNTARVRFDSGFETWIAVDYLIELMVASELIDAIARCGLGEATSRDNRLLIEAYNEYHCRDKAGGWPQNDL